MTPSEYDEAASSKSNKKVHQEYDHRPRLDQEKATPLEVAHMDVHKHEDIPKLDEAHLRLLGPKRLSRTRHTRCKVQTYKHGLALETTENVQVYNHDLTLDKEDDIQYTSALEDTLTPEDSLTRFIGITAVTRQSGYHVTQLYNIQ